VIPSDPSVVYFFRATTYHPKEVDLERWKRKRRICNRDEILRREDGYAVVIRYWEGKMDMQ